MRYLTREQILLIHSMLIDETGGVHGVRDHRVLFSLEQSPRQAVFGKELYPSPFLKAALYARNIIMNHPFMDGNKRTGMTAASVFLENNGYVIEAKPGEIEKFALKIIKQRLGLKNIARWIQKRSKK